VPDDAPTTSSKRSFDQSVDSMHEAERNATIYPKLTFAWRPPTYHFSREDAEHPRRLFAHFIPDSELQVIAEYTNRNAELQYAAEAFKVTPHFYGKH
jgi:hypothetical protein